MKSILLAATIVLVGFLVVQTHESVSARNVSVLCDSSEAESDECLAFGPLGAVNTAGIEIWARSFVDHGVELPQTIATQIRNRGKRI